MTYAIPAAVRPKGVTIAMIAVHAATCLHESMFTAVPAVGQGGENLEVGVEEGRAFAGCKGSTPLSQAAKTCAASKRVATPRRALAFSSCLSTAR